MCYILPPFSTEAGEVHVVWRVLKMLGASPARLRDKVVLHAVDDGVVLGGSPMPEPVRSSLQGPWCLTGDLCWASRSLDLVREVRCVPLMLCYVGVVLGVSPMPEPVRSSLQGPWCLTGDLCWASRSLDLVRKVRCVPLMLCYVCVVLGVSPMPEPVRSSLQGPWCGPGAQAVAQGLHGCCGCWS